ncbi:uncharacterized protein K489DRAFT_138971 [Dissoconium aciculare CBS 342.82]|uniref:Uncharacterized protein n=1 Tax=Dissoconium aciculare CBS 342.82 TaxID=1314786 RepID=A0A6J3LPH2_9PEZI|nr:uncharacterized protein K489DRAFT_138971 [Dissoconium aciculare CBS 342.82]KAF1817846.1 hypothetical protein K489DRAFT_138971 [Dissoconium aciculare CBS 342.82]
MSDLSGARASNGGARTTGPVPVGGTPGGIRTPRDVMRERNAREARRQEEEQKRVAEERRKSAERRAAATLGAGVPRTNNNNNNTAAQYNPDAALSAGGFDGAGERKSRGPGEVAGTNVLGDPTGRSSNEFPIGRARGSSVSQDQPRPATNTASSRRAASQSAPQQPPASSANANGAAPAYDNGSGSQRGTSSQFPHAFERWETLSSHWEGMTSYWLHRLEANTEEVKNTIPNAATLSRQITDLSAAGANLFHAVVELQRLRASSERKFQRWFFDTREHHEKLLEQKAEVDRELKAERSARQEATRQQSEAAAAVESARREVMDMRRELVIAKDEARRAWEELGRKNQESMDTAYSLKEGRITVVHGVQVVPYFGGPSRTASSAPRPATRDGPQQYGSVAPASSAGHVRMQSPEDERNYYREVSPTNTDPFTDSGRQQQQQQLQQQQQQQQQQHQPLHHEPGKPDLAQAPYQPYQSITPASAQTTVPTAGGPYAAEDTSPQYARSSGQAPVTSSSAVPTTTADAQRFYQHAGSEAYLHSPPASSGHLPPTAAPVYHHRRQQQQQPAEARSEDSYIDTAPSEDDNYDNEEDDDDDDETDVIEYALDSSGNVRHDDQGRPIVFASRARAPPPDVSPIDEHPRSHGHGHELAARYAEAMIIPEAPSVPATAAQAMATYPAPATTTSSSSSHTSGNAAAAAPPVDYEGEGYGGAYGDAAAAAAGDRGPAHHYPTRLSDVLEEEEERSSRRTVD